MATSPSPRLSTGFCQRVAAATSVTFGVPFLPFQEIGAPALPRAPSKVFCKASDQTFQKVVGSPRARAFFRRASRVPKCLAASSSSIRRHCAALRPSGFRKAGGWT
eukprot:11865931-Alexandrium_andersonii.AAC.2